MIAAADLLKALVRFPSLSYQEDAIATYVQSLVEGCGLPCRRVNNNVFFWIGDGSRRLLLNSHLDVVPPSLEHPYDPFDPYEVDGKIWGRGTVDAKASGAAMTAALLTLAVKGWEPEGCQVIVALTACEEVGARDNGLRELRPHLPALHAALIGEPTSLQPVIAQKGLLVLKVTARGRSAHAARADLGINAITQAAHDVAWLSGYRFPTEDPLLGAPTLCITTIHGGSARNVVPEECTFYVDIRTVPGYAHNDIVQDLDRHLASEVRVHSGRIVPVSTPPDASIVQSCLEALPGAKPQGSPTASDWIHVHDLPAVKIGPGASALSHTAQEHVERAEVERAARVYGCIIRSYCARTRT